MSTMVSTARHRPSRRGSLALGATALLVASLASAVVFLAHAGSGETALDLPRTLLQPPADTVRAEFSTTPFLSPEVRSISAAAEAPWGWVVLDRRSSRLALLSPTGEMLLMSGRRGEGPGELLRPISVAMAGSSIVVAETDGRLLLFDNRGGWLRDVAPRRTDCRGSRVEKILSGNDSLPALLSCISSSGEVTARVELLALDGGGRTLTESTVRDFASGVVDPLRVAMLGRVEGQLAFDVTPEACLRILGPRGAPSRLLCYPDLPRRQTPDSLTSTLGPLKDRLREQGVRLNPSDRLPPFHDLLSASGRWAFVSLPAEGGEAVDWVEGTRLHRLLLPEGAQLFLGRRSALLAEEQLEGTAFTVLPLP